MLNKKNNIIRIRRRKNYMNNKKSFDNNLLYEDYLIYFCIINIVIIFQYQ